MIYSPTKSRNATVEIDPDFRSLIPPLRPQEREQLEANIIAEGCRDPLVTWKGKGVILDGHNRYDICVAHGIDFKTVEIELANREAVEDWIDCNQLGRRNLTPVTRSLLRGRIYNRAKKREEDRQRSIREHRRPGRDKIPLADRTIPCECCRYPLSQAHHLLPFAAYGNNMMIIRLCANCHELFHILEGRILDQSDASDAIYQYLVDFRDLDPSCPNGIRSELQEMVDYLRRKVLLMIRLMEAYSAARGTQPITIADEEHCFIVPGRSS